MPILNVGPSSDYGSIAAAMQAAAPGDEIRLEAGYSNETATVLHNNMTVSGGETSLGIVLKLATGIPTITMTGRSPIRLADAADGNGIVGNAGNNRITVSSGSDAVDGGLGVDRLIVDYRNAFEAVTGDSTSNFAEAGSAGRMVTITDGTIEHFTVLTGSGADTITTGAGNDIIKTGPGASTISAGEGANIIIGGANADTITALNGGNIVQAGNGTNTVTTGLGKDLIFSGIGADTIVSGGRMDRIVVRGGADSVNAGNGTDRLTIDYGKMTGDVTGGITGGNSATGYVGNIADSDGNSVNFQGSENFTITTGSGRDAIVTGDGADVLRGGGRQDRLDAGRGDDIVFGEAGRDLIRGGLGTDIAVGGDGADVFIFATAAEASTGVGRDLIRDFHTRFDSINLSGIDANSNRIGNQAFRFIGSDKFSGMAGELRYFSGLVLGDLNGDGRADLAIQIGQFAEIRVGDFIL